MLGLKSFNRGMDYFQRGRVLSVKYVATNQIEGTVKGTRKRPYSVNVGFELGSDVEFEWLEGDCTCPVEFNCKHVAATLIAARNLPAPTADTAKQGLPGTVQYWLDQWPETKQEAEDKVSTKPSSEHLFYVFGFNNHGHASIESYRAYLKRDGTIGRNAKEYSGGASGRGSKFMTMQDVVALALLDFYRDQYSFEDSDWPEGEECVELVRSIIETGRARAFDIRGATLSWGPARRVEPVWWKDEQGYQQIDARAENGADLVLLPFPVPIYIDPATGEAGVAESRLSRAAVTWLASAPPAPAEASAELARRLEKLGADLPLPHAMHVEQRTSVRPQALLRLYAHTQDHKQYRIGRSSRGFVETETLTYPCAQLQFVYEGAEKPVAIGEEGEIQFLENDHMVVIRRDIAEERNFWIALDDAARPYGGGDPLSVYTEHSVPEAIDAATVIFQPIRRRADQASQRGTRFSSEEMPRLRAQGWQIEIDKTWPFHVYEGPVEFSTSAQSLEDDWFSFSFNLEADGQQLDLTEILLGLIEAIPLGDEGAIKEGFDIVEFLVDQDVICYLDDGRRVLFDAARLKPFIEAFLELQGLAGFHRAEAGRVAELVEALEGSGAPWRGSRELLEFGKRLRMLSGSPEVSLPASLQADLRPYQKSGYAWLRAVYDSGFGGVLADDMGLGKTVQTLSLLADRHLEEGVGRPSLVVVPTSLIGTWKREAARFTPKLKLLVLHGPDRHRRFSQIDKNHLVITTYPLVNRDHEVLFAQEYEVAVLDEAQWVKNPTAAVSKRIREIRARQRLALTGTPLENNLLELWSLFDWLIPGLLGNRKKFTSEYRTPIEKHGDSGRQRLLSARIKPFLLRRTKEQVAKELPKKTVTEELVPLEGSQAALYESIRSAMDERVRKAIAEKGLAASSITILDALLKLRQVCCDPELVKLDAARKVKESAKRERLLSVLEELVSEGRRILVFSQFVSMLKLIEADVLARGWEYAMLHGGTKHRDRQIQRFQSGKVPIFLISLKAGGTGLNLTAADTVVLFDPWWNPAVERQAMDRTHRIGQDKPVFVYRLIAENTVESAIAQMQVRKQALADALFEGTGEGPLALTEEDIEALFVVGA